MSDERYHDHETSCFFFPGDCMTNRQGTLEIYKTPSQLLRVEGPLSRYVRSSNNYCAMFDALFAAFLALLVMDPAYAQVSAPNCSDYTSNYTWVGYPWLVAGFQFDNKRPFLPRS
jgi:hypothetical protein